MRARPILTKLIAARPRRVTAAGPRGDAAAASRRLRRAAAVAVLPVTLVVAGCGAGHPAASPQRSGSAKARP
jgi:hypothetical protein